MHVNVESLGLRLNQRTIIIVYKHLVKTLHAVLLPCNFTQIVSLSLPVNHFEKSIIRSFK